MTTDPADTVGRILSRLALVGARRNALAQDTRGQILGILERSTGPLTVEQLCETTGLHHNTVRIHLDSLCASGSVVKERGPVNGRGRPPWAYRAAASTNDQYARLASSLRSVLAAADDEGLSAEAARRWRDMATVPRTADSPDEAVEVAAEVLSDLGFRTEVSAVGDEISLTDCPYSELVDGDGTVCRIHLAALVQTLEDTGQDVEVEELQVFPRPGVCVFRLTRNDLTPMRTLTPRDD